MKLTSFIYEKLLYIVSIIAAVVFTASVLAVHDIAAYSIFYIEVIIIAAGVIPFVAEFIKKRGFYNSLRDNLELLDKLYLLSEMLDKPDFLEGRLTYEALQRSNKSMNDEIAGYRISTEDYRDYIEKWVHDIKTPIAACKLAAENHPEYAQTIGENMEKINNYVMQTLFYSRCANVEKDYVIKKKTLAELTAASLRANSRQLINCGFSIERNNLDITVRTDEKWLGFILEQILTNSMNYRSKNPKLVLSGERNDNSTVLRIYDNGIGIAPEDLPRIFDKNFTGGNGRLNKNSTGFGLYICKKLCDGLGLGISAQSENGTTISIVFPDSMNSLYKSI